jgi:hypothetical protein
MTSVKHTITLSIGQLENKHIETEAKEGKSKQKLRLNGNCTKHYTLLEKLDIEQTPQPSALVKVEMKGSNASKKKSM